ncbi:MAG: chromosome segregation protein SMC [Candidatus Parabeggiatoa sp. nov. 3]|nr:MAG: chromosome segregation protein SMC [Gammaproteobacteria bacterium]RKZ63291.1 MAG: chromosome segregation protein SMC [Gammaproteobacteria bacterium]RKZ77291.1 MAG: chromosome segregation protein SMC [Gammaproteobacteria bacterium]
MISKITLENFFSFRQPTLIELNPDINILVGINGSGKSNFLKAIHLLAESIVGNGLEKIFLQQWSGFHSVINFNQGEKDYIKLSFEFDKNVIQNVMLKGGYPFPSNPIYEISIVQAGTTSYYLKEKLYSKRIKPDETDFIYMEMDNTQGIISTREGGKVGIQRYPQENSQINFKSTELVLRQISDPDRFYPLFTLKRALEEFSIYYYFDTSINSSIRQPTGYGTELKLLSDGQNLMTILNNIKNNHPLHYEKIEEAIRKINPYFKDINFAFLGSKLYLVLREKYLYRSVSIEHISDGTLHYLLLLSVLFNPERGYLVCIDEPETSLHPDMINTIAQAMKQASNSSQLIIATHSPLLLNSFDIDDILIFEKNHENETVVKSPDEFDEWNEDYLAGQAWLQGLIGGKRW